MFYFFARITDSTAFFDARVAVSEAKIIILNCSFAIFCKDFNKTFRFLGRFQAVATFA